MKGSGGLWGRSLFNSPIWVRRIRLSDKVGTCLAPMPSSYPFAGSSGVMEVISIFLHWVKSQSRGLLPSTRLQPHPTGVSGFLGHPLLLCKFFPSGTTGSPLPAIPVAFLFLPLQTTSPPPLMHEPKGLGRSWTGLSSL